METECDGLKMDKTIFVDKLRDFLNRHLLLTDECEAIFIMVQIRKILDCGRNPYRTLRFYCNWALHNELSQERTTRLLFHLLDPCIDGKKGGHDNARNIKLYNSDFFKLNTLKKELKDFIKEYTLPADLLKNKNWWKFARLLLEIIKESPVVFVPTEISKLEVIK